MKAHTNFNFL